jgi:Tol biopolymer transport system component
LEDVPMTTVRVAAFLVALTASVLVAQMSTTVAAPAPEVFAPNVISGPANDGAPAFMPDGKTLYFGRSGASWGFIVESHLVKGVWSEPEVAPFSGLWADSQPALAPDGSRLVFESRRPAKVVPGEKPKMDVSALWQVRRTAQGWSEPEILPPSVNITGNVWKPTLAANGDLYFMTRAGADKTWRLYRSRFREGAYQQAEPLAFSSGTSTDVDPEIAPDGSFLIFSSAGRAAASDAHEHLYITFAHGADWDAAIPLRYEGDYEKNPSDDGEAHLSPDGRRLYFTSSRTVPIQADRTREQAAEDFKRISTWDNSNNNAWSISLTPWLRGKS